MKIKINIGVCSACSFEDFVICIGINRTTKSIKFRFEIIENTCGRISFSYDIDVNPVFYCLSNSRVPLNSPSCQNKAYGKSFVRR